MAGNNDAAAENLKASSGDIQTRIRDLGEQQARVATAMSGRGQVVGQGLMAGPAER